MNHPIIELGPAVGDHGVRAVLVTRTEVATGEVSVGDSVLAVNSHELSGEPGGFAVLEQRDGRRTIAVCLGKEPVGLSTLRDGCATAVRAASAFSHLELLGLARPAEGLSHEQVAAVAAEAIELASYRYLKHKSAPSYSPLGAVHLAELETSCGAAVELGLARGRAANLARDLTNDPAEDLSPEVFSQVARRVAGESGLDVRVYAEGELAELGCDALLAVGKGSSRPPRLVRLGYAPDNARGHLALVGKGITFDSGGLNTKSTGGMELMRADMAGAASILAAMELVGRIRPDFAVTAWLALADNMSGPAAMRPGDVVRARNGVSIEILNTDAEGRLVLADALSMAAEERPEAIVDVATLTDTVSDALGPDVVGVMGNNRDLVRQVYLAGAASGEAVWPLPLPRSFAPLNESHVADVRNIQRGPYGFVVAGGCFLERFVDRLPWAHIDVGMAAMRPDPQAGNPPGATGWGVRMLAALIESFTKPHASDPAGWDPF